MQDYTRIETSIINLGTHQLQLSVTKNRYTTADYDTVTDIKLELLNTKSQLFPCCGGCRELQCSRCGYITLIN